MSDISEQYEKKKYKIYDLTGSELVELITNCFFLIGIKAVASSAEWQVIINQVRQYQGNVPISAFQDSFGFYAAGEIEVKDRKEFSAWFISKVVKAQRIKVFGEYKNAKKTEPETEKQAWLRFVNHLCFCGVIPANPDWIKLWNYCLLQGWFISENGSPLNRIERWNYRKYELAKKEVFELVSIMYVSWINDGLIYKGKQEHGNINNQSLGNRLRKSIEV